MNNFSDIAAITNAWKGWPYPYADPADCPDSPAWPATGDFDGDGDVDLDD